MNKEVFKGIKVAEFAWVLGAGPVGQMVPSMCGVYMPAQGQAFSGYANDQFDAACQQELLQLNLNPSPAVFADTQRILAQDLPALVLFHRIKIGIARPEVQGFYLSGWNPDLQNIETLSLTP